jgi:uncharacterized protein with PIN domain
MIRILNRFFCCGIILVFMAVSVQAAQADTPAGKSVGAAHHRSVREATGTFENSTSCSICHQNIYKQFRESMHARSFANPLFRKIFFGEVLKRSAKDETMTEEAEGCIACHSPLTSLMNRGRIGTLTEEQFKPGLSGVECDVCHRITGHKGPRPRNGNYLAVPGMQKFGPFPQQSDWHHAYSELQTRSEVCAVCHSRVNRFGLEIISTFSEWEASRYAGEGIQCQDCHMNAQGFLTAGKPVFESGKASQNTSADSPLRSRLYTHRFPGAHSETQVKGAIRLDMQVETPVRVPGKKPEIQVIVVVDNSKSGHKLPTGTVELRMVYLDLYAQVGERRIPIPASSANGEVFDVSGRSRFDAEILGKDFPQGRRLYRAICVDSADRPTFYSFDAQKIVFDNRLSADEIRKEFFTLPVPEDIGKEFSLVAKLYYLRYPDPFAERLGVGKAASVELAAVRKDIVLGGQAD